MTSRSTPSVDPTGGIPAPEPRPIYLRAYAEPTVAPKPAKRRPSAKPSKWVLCFDCETTADEVQRLRFGAYQVRRDGILKEKGLFFDPDAVDGEELEALQMNRPAGLALRTLTSFVEDIFYDIGYAADATIVGFNLPFDISRLALDCDTARQVRRNGKIVDRSMAGGFTLRLSHIAGRPNVRIKPLSRRAAFINFAAPSDAPTGERASRGFFLDLKTLAAALTSKSFKLASLAEHLGVPAKGDFKDFGRKIDRTFIQYAVQDVEVTWRCFEQLHQRYDAHHLGGTQPTRIYSEASLGKAYLRAMGIKPWLSVETTRSPVTIGRTMSTYYGGRAEVHRRREVVRVLYCDFVSMYPTACTLMGLWRFVIANGVEEHDATADVRSLLANLTVDQLNDPAFWPGLCVLVEVKPDADIFPVRARYGEGPSHTIGVNYLSADRTLWFTLADCVASVLLTGKPLEVVSAIQFAPKGRQEELTPVEVAGAGRMVDPASQDFYRTVIDIRRSVKVELAEAQDRQAPKLEQDRLDSRQQALKILANATAYGVFIELNPSKAEDGEGVRVCGADAPFAATPAKIEGPGAYFHPLLATLITGAARLMLAIAETLALREGLDWAFCDTDSMALAKPEEMSEDDFVARVDKVRRWFETLNPYEEQGSILKLEDENSIATPSGGKMAEPLYCFAISAKRYALFNLAPNGEIIIRKASAHGLGHLRSPYADDPDDPVLGSGVRLWQEHLWRQIIRAALDGHSQSVSLDWHGSLADVAVSQHTTSTPDLLRPFRRRNAGRSYAEGVKPFNFMLRYYAKRPAERVWEAADPDLVLWHPRERPPKATSPYYRDPRDVPADAIFDLETGEPVAKEGLRSYADVLRGYHRSPETKFLGGGPSRAGPLRRRHIRLDQVINIGKEADAFEETEEFGEDEEDVTVYGQPPESRAAMVAAIASVPVRKLKARAKVGHALIAKAAAGDPGVSDRVICKLHGVVLALTDEAERSTVDGDALRQWAAELIADGRYSLAGLARGLDHDPSNLAKALSAGPLSSGLTGKLRRLKKEVS
jgi:hypothetical protein